MRRWLDTGRQSGSCYSREHEELHRSVEQRRTSCSSYSVPLQLPAIVGEDLKEERSVMRTSLSFLATAFLRLPIHSVDWRTPNITRTVVRLTLNRVCTCFSFSSVPLRIKRCRRRTGLKN